MSGQILVSFFITVVFLDVMEVFTPNDDSALHLGRNDTSSQNTTTDGNISSEGALLIDIMAFDSLLGSLEAKTNVLVPTLGDTSLGHDPLGIEENSLLVLERTFDLRKHNQRLAIIQDTNNINK